MTHNDITPVVLSVLSITLLLMFMSRSKKEKFCGSCRGIGIKTCPNRPLLHKLYNDGKLTEFTELHRRPWKGLEWNKFQTYQKSGKTCC